MGGDGVWQCGEASEPQRIAELQGWGGQSREILAQKISAGQHSPAQEASLITCQGGGTWELRLRLRIPGRGLGLAV